ncbi:MAG: PAS domain-containing protein [Cytophagia bacterium]|nr:PAS domain-containing protein [Cytophagia bacterium]
MKEFFEKPYTRSLAEGLELKGRKKNGSLFWIEVGLSPVSVEGETLVMAVVTDVSKKKDAEIKLEQSYRQMNNLVNNLPGIVYQCRNDQYWTMDYISPACEQITGYAQKEFYGSPSNISYADLIVAEEREEIWGQVQESLSRKVPFRVTYRIKDKAGEHKWMWEQGVGVFDEQGAVLGLEGCIFDISPLIKNQEKINQAIYTAEDKERRRIASDLHDGVQQILGASSLNLKFIEKDVDKLSDKVRKHYQKSLSFLDEGIKETRNIAHRLMPKEVEQLGFDSAIEQLLVELKNNLGIEVSFYNNLQSRLNSEAELGLYRVAQEAFNNIVKYSQATHVSIQLIAIDDEVQLMIEDNGVGFDKNKIDLYSNGFGLSGMKNRIISLSGQLTVDSRPGRGTSIIAWLPKNLMKDGAAN